MQQFIYLLRPTRVGMVTEGPTPEEMQVLGAHAAYLDKLAGEGTMLLAGRTQNNDASTLGLALFFAESEAAARSIMEADPAVSGGVMKAELYPYAIAFKSSLLRDLAA